jgi:hypothetical protein
MPSLEDLKTIGVGLAGANGGEWSPTIEIKPTAPKPGTFKP